MSSSKLQHDASASTKGIVYQFYMALSKCFEMTSGQKVIIERFGDVTLSESQQLEIKRSDTPLTDSHINIWQTLANWVDEKFDDAYYTALILCTTQEISAGSLWAQWNTSSTLERRSILEKIHASSEERESQRAATTTEARPTIPEVLKLQRKVLHADNFDKCLRVAGKFAIASHNPDFSGLHERLRETHGNHVLQSKCDDYLHALLGYILNPAQVSGTQWEITYEEFSERVRELTGHYCVGTKRFPTKHLVVSPSAIEETKNKDGLFIQKIKDIQYEEVIVDAIEDYVYASDTVTKDLLHYSLPLSSYRVFAHSVLSTFEPSFRKALRGAEGDVIRKSKDFYDDTMISPVPAFPGFDLPNPSFRNGVIHMHCDDPSKNVQWKLKIE